MKKPLFLLILLLISNNVFVFLYGLRLYSASLSYHSKQQDNFVLDSALALAVHAYEDSPTKTGIEQEFSLAGRQAGYTARRLDSDGVYFRVYLKKKDGDIYREYLQQGAAPGGPGAVSAGLKPLQAPRIPAPVTGTAQTNTPRIIMFPTAAAVAVPTFTLIK
jgi:hypothetical protein